MKKPKDVTDLANRLASAASTPLVPPPVAMASAREERTQEATSPRPRKAPNRSTIPLFLRVPEPLFEKYDAEAIRRTKATGRGVTAQQVILELLEKGRPNA